MFNRRSKFFLRKEFYFTRHVLLSSPQVKFYSDIIISKLHYIWCLRMEICQQTRLSFLRLSTENAYTKKNRTTSSSYHQTQIHYQTYRIISQKRMKAKEMFQQRNAKNPGVIYLRKFFLIFGELYTGLLKYFHGKFKFFSMKKTLQYFMPSIAPTLFFTTSMSLILPWVCSYQQYWIAFSDYLKNSL